MKARKYIKGTLLVFLFFILWFVVHSAVIVIDGMTDDLVVTDAAVVLGNKVELDGQPSARLQARLDKAASLYEQGYFGTIIVSGGVGKEGFDEALVMKEYLVDKGISSVHIIMDSNGYNTAMTAENTFGMKDQLGINSVTVISQYHHVTRTKLAFRKVGFENVYGTHAEIIELRDLYSILREFAAFYKYLFFK